MGFRKPSFMFRAGLAMRHLPANAAQAAAAERDCRVPLLVWLLASLATAACAHALIERMGRLLEADTDLHADAYAAHAHVAIVPLVVLISMLLVSILLTIAARAVAHGRRGGGGIEALAEKLRGIRTTPAIGFVACGGIAILFGMELLEQAVASGHFGTFAEALGGNVALGLSTVGIVATALTTAGLRASGALASATAATALSIVSWIVARLDAMLVAVLSATGRVRRPRGRVGAIPGLYASSCCGLRAPPISA